MPRKPIWSEGAFVSQHHFQVQDLYHEGLLRDRIAAARRFDWGILDLAIDERLLQAGQFRLRRLEAIWPDGTLIRCGGPSEDPAPEARSFEGLFGTDAASFDVFVGLPSESVASGNVTGPGESSAQRRFSRVALNVPDFNTGGSVQDVEVAEPNVRVLFGPERRDKVSTLHVAQLTRQSTGQIIVRDNFVPPVLHIAAAPFVKNGIQRVLGAVTARQRDLSATRKQRQAGAIVFDNTDARRFWLLHTLNAAIPILSHLVEMDKVHPEEVYLALSAMIGQLCTFSADVDPSTLPRFNYNQLGEIFEQLFARALSLLSVDAVPVYTEVALERRPDGMFVGRIHEPRLLNHEFFIAVKSELAEAIVRERVPQLLKIAAWGHIVEVVKQARFGVRTEVDYNPSSSLPLKPGLCFFRMRREGPFWEEIAKTSTLALYLPREADWKDALLFVYAIDPEYLR